MARKKHLAVGVSVLAVGACAAIPFYRVSAPPPRLLDRPQEEELVLRPEPAPMTAQNNRAAKLEIAASSLGKQDDGPLQATTGAFSGGAQLQADTPPPRLAPIYPGAAEIGPGRYDGARAGASAAPFEESSGERVVAEPGGVVLHRIVDGDTLVGLAQRYLHDAARYMEIQQANADLLSNPELLPIGAVIKIPKLPNESEWRTLPAISNKREDGNPSQAPVRAPIRRLPPIGHSDS